MAEVSCLKGLSQTNFNFDRKFSLVFEDTSSDARDERPANYDGRFCIPMRKAGSKENKNCFTKSKLWAKGTTDIVAFTKSADMVLIEDMDEDAMPTATDDKHTVAPSIRFQQVGAGAV